MSEYIEERTYLPTGCDRDDFNASTFQVGVYYRGRGKWCVATSREAHQQLSRTGRWLWCPSKMTAIRWCRFDFAAACEMAEAAVETRVVNGHTWAEWRHISEETP